MKEQPSNPLRESLIYFDPMTSLKLLITSTGNNLFPATSSAAHGTSGGKNRTLQPSI